MTGTEQGCKCIILDPVVIEPLEKNEALGDGCPDYQAKG